jgi:hypothetical protein
VIDPISEITPCPLSTDRRITVRRRSAEPLTYGAADPAARHTSSCRRRGGGHRTRAVTRVVNRGI